MFIPIPGVKRSFARCLRSQERSRVWLYSRPHMAKHLIAVIPGDGIGTEVIAQATRVLELYRDTRGIPLDLWQLDLGADRYLRDGTTYPKEVRERIEKEARAVLLGALGDPRVPGLEPARYILFGLRFGLDLYANIR